MAITVEMRTQVSELYVAVFGRAPDSEGLDYWVTALDSGDSLDVVANNMYATDPARAYYPTSYTPGEIIESFYLNVLGRAADADGLAYWTAKLGAPGATNGSVINAIIAAVTGWAPVVGGDPVLNAAGLVSQNLLNNRVEVAQWYAEEGGDAAGATAILSTVTEDPATADAVMAGTIPTTGETFTLTTANDSLAGGAGADTFTGTYTNGDGSNTFNVGDTLAGGGGTDTLHISPAAVGAAITLDDTFWSHITDVEEIVFGDTTAGVQTFATGANFNSAFTAGVTVTTVSTGGAITFNMTGTVAENVTLTTTSTAGIQTIDTSGNGTGTGNATVSATSTSSAQTITTGAGNDSVTSATDAGLNNTISTNAGNDTIVGGLGIDSITAGADNDYLTGGSAGDSLFGGAGSDVFVYRNSGAAAATWLSTYGSDTISDYATGGQNTTALANVAIAGLNGDVLLFDYSDLAGLTGFVANTGFVVTGDIPTGTNGTTGAGATTIAQGAGITTAGVAYAQFIYNSTDGVLRFDADGSGGGAVPIIVGTLTTGLTLTATDFLFVA